MTKQESEIKELIDNNLLKDKKQLNRIELKSSKRDDLSKIYAAPPSGKFGKSVVATKLKGNNEDLGLEDLGV